LQAEHEALLRERARLDAAEPTSDRTHALSTLATRLAALEERLASAVVVDPSTQPHDEARFGASVTLHGEAGAERRYTIVGVDEADVSAGRIAFVAPLARALLGKRVGDVATVRTPRGDEEWEVVAIAYVA
jgi:transcription elongation factor GreB